MRLKRTVRYYLNRFMRLQGSIRSLALGSAIGTAVGVTPTLPCHNVLILAFTLPIKANPIAGILAANVVSNPLTFVPQYYLAWWIGNLLFPGRLSWEKIHSTLDMLKTNGIRDSLDALRAMGMDAITVMLTGGLVMAVPTGLVTYLLVHRFFVKFRKKKHRKHLLNRKE